MVGSVGSSEVGDQLLRLSASASLVGKASGVEQSRISPLLRTPTSLSRSKVITQSKYELSKSLGFERHRNRGTLYPPKAGMRSAASRPLMKPPGR